MAKAINTLYKIHTGLYGTTSVSFGIIGGSNTLKYGASIGATTIVTNITTSNFYIYPTYDKIKITDGANSDYLTVKTCTRSYPLSQYSIETYQPLLHNYTSASSSVYLESYFGWSEFNQTASSDTYGNFIKQDIVSVPEIERSIDISVGGNVQNETGGDLKISNKYRLHKYLSDNSMNLQGCKIDCLMSVDNAFYQLGTYKIDKTEYTSTEFDISFSAYNRNAVITKKINSVDNPNCTKDLIGTSIPLVFGNNYPSTIWDGYAKFIRSADVRSDMPFEHDCSTWATGIYFVTPSLGTEGIKAFPCIDTSSATVRRTYNFAIGSSYEGTYSVYSGSTHLTSGTHELDLLTDKYAYVVQGQEQGEYRKIENVYVDLDTDANGHTIVITFADYFKNVLKSNPTATETDNTWIKIIDAKREYVGETWPCYNFLSSSGQSISSNYEVYSYLEKKSSDFDVSGSAETLHINVDEKDMNYSQLPTTTFDIINSNKNSIKTSFKQASNDLDSFDSFTIKPLSDIVLTPLDNAGFFARYGIFEDYGTANDGIYYVGPIGTISVGANYSDVIDKNASTYHDIIIHDKQQAFGDNSQIVISFDLTFPTIDFEFDNIYLGIKSKYISLFSDPPTADNRTVLAICNKQFMGSRSEIYLLDTTVRITDLTFYDIADEYFYPTVNTNNKYFYSSEHSDTYHTGYDTYDVSSLFTNENYGTHKYISLWYWNVWDEIVTPDLDQEFELQTYECCLIFKRKTSTKKQLYIPFSGRIFNGTWETRKTAASLIDNPVDTLEHIMRLQDRSDYDPSGIKAGLEYNYVPMINTPYIDWTLSGNRDSNAFSITEYDKSNTDYIKKELCKQFGLICYSDLNGIENIKSIDCDDTEVKNFTLADIVDRKSISVKMPNISNIYCEPFVKYNYNIAAEKYDGYIAITNVTKSTYDSSYVIGLTSNQEFYWTLCRLLYQQYKIINTPPENYTNLSFINGINSNTYAQAYLSYMVLSMYKNEYTFDIHINDCYTLNIGDIITVNFPIQTNGVAITCMISKIVYKLKNNYSCTISALSTQAGGIG